MFRDLLDVLGPTVEAISRSIGIDPESKFCGDYNVLSERSEGLTHEFFVGERAISLGGVKKCYAAFHGGPYEGDHFHFVSGWAIIVAHAHAAQPEGRDLKVTVSELSRLHLSFLFWNKTTGAS
jgi:hypothetical protein